MTASPVSRIGYYLSEMAVSDQHGGGLTLQSVLGGGLDHVRRFVTFGQFALDRPAAPKYLARSEVHLPFAGRPGPVRRLSSRFAHYLGVVLSRQQTSWDRARLREYVRRDPEACWLVCPQSAYVPRLWNGLPEPVSRRYVTWVMDDHVVRHDGRGWSYPPGFGPVMARHLRQAARVFVISPAMRDFYKERFGVESTVLFGGVPSATGPARGSAAGPADRPPRLAYFGSIWDWQLGPLTDLAAALPRANATLDVYCFGTLPAPLSVPGVTHRGTLPRQEVPARMAGYDAVVLPISAADELREMTDLNIATKMSECLASGTVTLVIGPDRAAMVRFLRPHDSAVLVTGAGPDELAAGVRACVDPAVRDRVCRNAGRLVRDQLTNDTMRQRFESALAELGVGRPPV